MSTEVPPRSSRVMVESSFVMRAPRMSMSKRRVGSGFAIQSAEEWRRVGLGESEAGLTAVSSIGSPAGSSIVMRSSPNRVMGPSTARLRLPGAGEPDVEGIRGNGETKGDGLPAASASRGGIGPWEESRDRAGSAGLVTEVEVIRGGIIEVHGALDEAETEETGVKLEIALRIACERGDMMKAPDHCFQFGRSATLKSYVQNAG